MFRFASYLRKILLLTFLFSESHVRADNPGGQSVKHDVWGWAYFWALVGTIFFTMGQAKTKLKKVLSDIFLNIYKIIPEHIPTTIRIMQKLCFAVEFCICISNRIPCVKVLQMKLIAETVYFLLSSGYLAAHARSKCGWIRLLHKISSNLSTGTCFSTEKL